MLISKSPRKSFHRYISLEKNLMIDRYISDPNTILLISKTFSNISDKCYNIDDAKLHNSSNINYVQIIIFDYANDDALNLETLKRCHPERYRRI